MFIKLVLKIVIRQSVTRAVSAPFKDVWRKANTHITFLAYVGTCSEPSYTTGSSLSCLPCSPAPPHSLSGSSGGDGPMACPGHSCPQHALDNDKMFGLTEVPHRKV